MKPVFHTFGLAISKVSRFGHSRDSSGGWWSLTNSRNRIYLWTHHISNIHALFLPQSFPEQGLHSPVTHGGVVLIKKGKMPLQ
jgi:hypothetical protein